MAGIGWRLERLIHRGITGAAAVYATGAAVMALPWVLTTAVLASLPVIVGRASADFGLAESVVDVAYAVALLVAGPVQVVISRYSADRLYERRLHAIAAPLCRGLAATLLLCAVPAAITLLSMHVPLRACVWGAALSAAVGAEWTALSVGNGLCSPGLVLGAVVVGSAQSLLAAAALVALSGLGVPGYLVGLISGQLLTLAILLVGILRALPDEADETARLLPAFRDYAALAVAGLAFNASLWADKLIAWWLAGGERAALHSEASTLAWFATIPVLAWIFVEVETTFHWRFRRFFRSLEEGAPLEDLRGGIRALRGEAARLLGGALSVQAGIVLFLELGAESLARWLRVSPEVLPHLRLLLIACAAQAVALLGLILLYYFDLRREAALAATGLLIAIVAFTTAAAAFQLLPGAGTALGACLGAALIWHAVFRGIEQALRNTLLGQPIGVERDEVRRARLRAPRRSPGPRPSAARGR